MSKPRGIIIAGNWKMNLGPQETEQFFKILKNRSNEFVQPEHADLFEKRQIQAVLCPPFLSLERAAQLAGHLSFPLTLAAQNTHWEKSGAFTGEVSGPMLQSLGIQWSLVGHSERRQYFGETDLTVQKRTQSLLGQGFHVIVCIGETQAEREAGKTHEVLARQLETALPKSSQEIKSALQDNRLILAYEPVWAIGTGLTASPEQAQEAHQFIRSRLVEILGGVSAANSTSILYGGSVSVQNIDSLLNCSDVDGALVGGASLKPEGFLALLSAGVKAFAS